MTLAKLPRLKGMASDTSYVRSLQERVKTSGTLIDDAYNRALVDDGWGVLTLKEYEQQRMGLPGLKFQADGATNYVGTGEDDVDEGYERDPYVDDPENPGQKILLSVLQAREAQQQANLDAKLGWAGRGRAMPEAPAPKPFTVLEEKPKLPGLSSTAFEMKPKLDALTPDADLPGKNILKAGYAPEMSKTKFMDTGIAPSAFEKSGPDITDIGDHLWKGITQPEKPLVDPYVGYSDEAKRQAKASVERGETTLISPPGTSALAANPIGKGDDLFAAMKRSADLLKKAREAGPEAFAAEKARQGALMGGKINAAFDTQKANAATRFGDTAKADLAATSDEMAAAAQRARELADGPNLHAGIPIMEKDLGTFTDNLLAVANVSKRMQASGDIGSSMFRQNLPAAFINPKIWSRNASRAVRAYFEDPAARGVMEEVERLPLFAESDVRRAISVLKPDGTMDAFTVPSMQKVLGIGEDFATPGFEKFDRGVVSKMGDKLMSIGEFGTRSEKAQEAALLGTATEYYSGMVEAARRVNIADPNWYKQYGQIAKVWAGYGDVPKTLKGISSTFYSLRNVAARLQTLTKPLTSSGAVFRSPQNMLRDKAIFSASPRGVASQYLTRFAAGETAHLAWLAAAGKHSGLFEVGWNPLASGFGSMKYEDSKGAEFTTDLLGGYGSLIKALARTAAYAKDTAEGKESEFNPVQEWLQFSRYKMTSMPGAVVDTVINAAGGDAGPYAVDWKNPDSIREWLVNSYTPFFLQGPAQMISEIRAGDMDSSPAGLARFGGSLLTSFAGAPVGFNPATASEKAGNAAMNMEGMPKTFLDKDGKEQPITSYAELNQADPEAADRWLRENPQEAARLRKEQGEASQESNKLKADFFQRQQERDKLIDTDPEAWRRESSAAARELGIRLDQLWAAEGDFKSEPRGLLDVANGKYHDAIEAATNAKTQEVDWDSVDRAVASMSEQERELLFKSRLAGETEPRKQYIRDLEKLVPYFEQRDRAWAEITANDPEAAQYKSLDDFKQVLVAELHADGLGWTEAEAKIESKLSGIQEKVGKYANAYLAENAEELLPLLDRYDFYVPSKFKKYVRRGE